MNNTMLGISRYQDFKRQSIFGHSMGGHGALTLYLASKTKQYRSASAFAPISNPTKCPWGEKAFNGYLEGGISEGTKYDATELISKTVDPVHILIDYVSKLCASIYRRFLIASVRALAIISTSKVSFYLKLF